MLFRPFRPTEAWPKKWQKQLLTEQHSTLTPVPLGLGAPPDGAFNLAEQGGEESGGVPAAAEKGAGSDEAVGFLTTSEKRKRRNSRTDPSDADRPRGRGGNNGAWVALGFEYQTSVGDCAQDSGQFGASHAGAVQWSSLQRRRLVQGLID